MSERLVVKVIAVALLLFAVGAVALSDNPFAEQHQSDDCTEYSGVLYLDNDTVRNTSDGGVNVTFTVCDETGPFDGSTEES